MSVHRRTLEEAKAAGRTTQALLDAAQRQTGISSTTELVEIALAALAVPDPCGGTEKPGVLGEDNTLDV